MSKNQRFFQILAAMMLSMGLLFTHNAIVFAEEDNAAPAETVQNSGDDKEEVSAPEASLSAEEAHYSDVIDAPEAYVPDNPDPVQDAYVPDAGDVSDAINDAAVAEGAAAVVAIPAGGDTSAEIWQNEENAIASDAAAADTLEILPEIQENLNQEVAEHVVEAGKDAAGTLVADVEVIQAQHDAEEARDSAEQNVQEVINADTEAEAVAAVEKAQENAQVADAAAQTAYEKAQVANDNAAKAAEEYEKALEDYQNAEAAAQAALAEGSAELEDALQSAELAQAKAQEYYDRMIAAQAEAHAATETAEEEAKQANADLLDSLKELADVTEGGAKTVAEKTALTAASEAAFEAAKIAEGIASIPVNLDNKQIAALEEQIDALDAAIQDAEKALADAEQELNDFIDSDEYQAAKEKYDDALLRMNTAIEVYETAARLLEERAQAESTYKNKMEELQAVLPTVDPEQEQEKYLSVVHDLTEIVFTYGEDPNLVNGTVCWDISIDQAGNPIVWDQDYDNVFYVLNEDGEAFYYSYERVEEDGNVYLAYTPASFNEITEVVDATGKDTKEEYDAVEAEPKTYNLQLLRYDIKPSGYSVTMGEDSYDAYLFEYRRYSIFGKLKTDSYHVLLLPEGETPDVTDVRKAIDLIQRIGRSYPDLQSIIDKGGLITDYSHSSLTFFDDPRFTSNLITDAWADAEANLDNYAADVLNELFAFAAVSAEVQPVFDQRDELADQVEGIQLAIEDYESRKNDVIEQRDAVVFKRDGNATDEIIRYYVGGFEEAANDMMAEHFGLLIDSITRELTEEEQARLEYLNTIDYEMLSKIFVVRDAIQSGEVDEETLNTVEEILRDLKLADRTKLAVSTAVRDYFEEAYHANAQALEDAKQAAKDSVKNQSKVVAQKMASAAEADQNLAKAKVLEGKAIAASIYAKTVLDTATKAVDKAKEALDTFNAFVASYKPNDFLLRVVELEKRTAEELAKIADRRAELAAEAAEDAHKAAQKAEEEYINTKYYPIYVSGTQVSSRNKENVLNDRKHSVVYDDAENTLILNGANIAVKQVPVQNELSAGIYTGQDLTVAVKKSSKIQVHDRHIPYTKSAAGIVSTGNLEIKTDDSQEEKQSLKIDLQSPVRPLFTLNSTGIGVFGNLTFSNIDVVAEAGATRPNEKTTSRGIYVYGDEMLVWYDANVEAIGSRASESYGILAPNAIIWLSTGMLENDSPEVTAKAGKATFTSTGIVAKDIYAMNLSQVRAEGSEAPLSFGVVAYDSVILMDNTDMTAVAEKAVVSTGILAASVMATDDSLLVSYSDDAEDSSTGILAQNVYADENAHILAMGGKANKSFGIYISPSDIDEDEEFRNGVEIGGSENCKITALSDEAVEDSVAIFGNVYGSDFGKLKAISDTTTGEFGNSIGVEGDVELYNGASAAITTDAAYSSIGVTGNVRMVGGSLEDLSCTPELTISMGDAVSHQVGIDGNADINQGNLTIKVADFANTTPDFSKGIAGKLNVKGYSTVSIQTANAKYASIGIDNMSSGEEGETEAAITINGPATVDIKLGGAPEGFIIGVNGTAEVVGYEDEQAKLNITVGGTSQSFTGINGDANPNHGNINIQGKEDAVTDTENAIGINGNILAQNNSSIFIDTPNASNDAYGVNAELVSVKDSSLVSLAGNAGNNSYGIYSETGILGSDSHVYAASGAAGNDSYGIYGGIYVADTRVFGISETAGNRTAGIYANGMYLDNSNVVGRAVQTADDERIPTSAYGIYSIKDIELKENSVLTGDTSSVTAELYNYAIRADVKAPHMPDGNNNSQINATAGSGNPSVGLYGNLELADQANGYFNADAGSEMGIGIVGDVTLHDNSYVRASATDNGENGIGLSGKLVALDASKIDLLGSNKALSFVEDNWPETADRGIQVNASLTDESLFKYWNKVDDLRSPEFHWIRVADDAPEQYAVVSGGGQSWITGSDNPITLVARNTDEKSGDITFDYFARVTVDGKVVDPSNYTVKRGSVILSLKPSYLKTLAKGQHALNVVFTNGTDAATTFTVKDADPKPIPSGGGSSSKSSGGAKSTSSVVTCQMAGYPNGYVWNEAAKACQFGYLDGNGNFHSGAAASARTRVPNTADGNSLMMFLFSCVTALGAAFLLRRDH